jgi:hypothetical protein
MNKKESLYEFFDSRYELEEIKYSVVYDFYSSISVYAARSKVIQLLWLIFDWKKNNKNILVC